jgi:tRNA(Ile)-lysidine synthase
VLVVREAAAMAGPAELPPRQRLRWDQRFLVRGAFDGGSPITIGALGARSRSDVRDPVFHARVRTVPGLARPVLPALWDAHGLLAVPSLGWNRSDRPIVAEILFAPVLPLAGPTFGVV